MLHRLTSRGPRAFGSVAATLVCLATVAVPSGQSPPQAARPPAFRTEANYVRVDVFATRGGASVGDLRRDEFQLLEDRVPQTIDEFSSIVIRPGGATSVLRAEPRTIEESRDAAMD